jgi:hypothetical protein|tara:strand:- start:469 stop:942 length:474 start_codon:yes stop_codon:yes gene_type:complete
MINHLAIYFETSSGLKAHKKGWTEQKYNQIYDIASDIFLTNNIIQNSRELFCFPNFSIKSDIILNNVNIQNSIPALENKFGAVCVINTFYSRSPLKLNIAVDNFEVGFSHVTRVGYTQQLISINTSYLKGNIDHYIQNYMIYPYFLNRNIGIDLEQV